MSRIYVDMSIDGKSFEDGCDLCSPGRWPPHKRITDSSGYSQEVRGELLRALTERQDIKDTLKLLAPSFITIRFLEVAIEAGRAAWLRVMQAKGANVAEVTGERHSPIAVGAVAKHLRLAQDPDFAFFHGAKESLTKGLPIGVDRPLPRCPGLYEEKIKHRVYEEQAVQIQLHLGEGGPAGSGETIHRGGAARGHEKNDKGQGRGTLWEKTIDCSPRGDRKE